MGGYNLGVQSAQADIGRRFQQAEEERVANREALANLHQQVLQSPDSTPEQRTQALTAISGLYKPQEAPTLFARLGGLIHGQAAAPASQPASSSALTAPAIAPTYTNELGDTVPHQTDANGAIVPPAALPTDSLGIPISDPDVATAHAQPMHPMATSHPVLDRLHEGLDALGNHLKGFAQPVAPAPAPDLSSEFSNYKGPVAIQRESADLANTRALDLAQKKGELNIEGRKVTAGGSSAQARYLRAFATEMGKEPADLSPEEMQQGIREYGEANRRPQTMVDPTTGIVNVVTRDDDGNPIAAPMRDSNGQLFGGFKPNTVTIRNGVYHFIGADNQVHEVPVTTTSTKIFGPHFNGTGDKPVVVPKADPDATPVPIAAAPPVSSLAPQAPGATPPPAPAGNGAQRRGAAIKATPTTQPISANAPQSPSTDYPGKSIGAAHLPAANLKVVTTTEPVIKQVDHLIGKIDELGLKDNNTPGYLLKDRLKYGMGMASDPGSLGSEIANLSLGSVVEAASALSGSSRSLPALRIAMEHTPAVYKDSPKLMREKLTTIRARLQDMADEARTGAFQPANQPVSSAAPKAPGSAQTLTDRLNEALAH